MNLWISVWIAIQLFPPCFSFHYSTQSTRVFGRPATSLLSSTNVNGESKPHPFESNELAHVMLKVLSVNDTVDYYVNRGATVRSYNKLPSGTQTAFVNFASSAQKLKKSNDSEEDEEIEGYFSLEITSAKADDSTYEVGNSIRYIGLSMLINFDKSNLESIILKKKSPSTLPLVDHDPNGIVVKSVASAPGDMLARLCLAIDSTKATIDEVGEFYTRLLGMEEIARDDEDCICLRYNGSALGKSKDETGTKQRRQRDGVATTLVFELLKEDNEPLLKGSCFDHFVIQTENMDAAAAFIKQQIQEKAVSKVDDNIVFMEPTKMFGTSIMGITDPNGYKIYLMERKKK